MKITAQELIDELKKLPPNSHVGFTTNIRVSIYGTSGTEKKNLSFDRIVFSNPPTIELLE